MATNQYVSKLVKKASQSICRSRVAALGFNKKNECVITTVNKPNMRKKGGGIHAEEQIFKVARKYGIVKILICRIGSDKKLLPIDPCESCAKTAKKLGIEITSIKGI
jgi:hypothetical protein